MKALGTVALGVWLVLTGLIGIADLSFKYDDLVVGAFALVAGILILARR
ncbi:MAG: hypothetical protein V3S12_05920 [Acidiferrobacterales bacterium]